MSTCYTGYSSRIPFGDEGCYSALLIAGCALRPCAVGAILEGADGEKVAILSVDGDNNVGNELGNVDLLGLFVGEVSPGGIYGQLLVFASAIHGCIVHVDDVLTLLAIRLHDEFLHLLYGKINGDNLRDAEECARRMVLVRLPRPIS